MLLNIFLIILYNKTRNIYFKVSFRKGQKKQKKGAKLRLLIF